MSLFSTKSEKTSSKPKWASSNQRDALSTLTSHIEDFLKGNGSTGNIESTAQGVTNLFRGLLGNAAGSMSGVAGGSSVPSFDNALSNSLYGTAARMGPDTSTGTNALYGTAANALGTLTDWQSQAQGQLASLKSGLTSMWSKDIMPGLTSKAVSAGGFGGGRAGVAQGVAYGNIADTYASSSGDIFASARNSANQAAGNLTAVGNAMDARQANQNSAMANFASLLGSLGGQIDTRGVNQATALNNATANRINAAGQLGSLSGTAMTNALAPILSVLQAFESARNGIGPLALGTASSGKSSGYEIGTGR